MLAKPLAHIPTKMASSSQSGIQMPSATCVVNTGNPRLASNQLQNQKTDLPLLQWIADRARSDASDSSVGRGDRESGERSLHGGPKATSFKGMIGEIIPLDCQVDRRPAFSTFFVTNQRAPLFSHIDELVRDVMQQATTGEVLPLYTPPRVEPRTERRARIVGEWPALLSREQLCEYLDICPSSFAKVCPVAPVDLGVNVLRWRRTEIDAWLARLLPRSLKVSTLPPVGHTTTQSPEIVLGPDERRAAALERARKATKARS